ncbi:hypothetical protein [Myxococcus qinghaiensis]|uniref:hypothetical protein n=1 Tax=Myxococcus qinghaiensis TaxID=2906758 RepID=UPI0020A7F339|nr:hypothetical protein [Myxococcus qinghaiensis]MCP3167482.1 hypothetical protein [Myxococcus qinghaiensis]
MKTQSWMRGGLLALVTLVGGVSGSALGQTTAVLTHVAKTPPSHGEAGDQVVASVVDTGIRTGGSQVVTLQLLDSAGTIVAQTSGVVDGDSPLRVSHRATSANPLFARVIAATTGTTLSAAVVTVERWSPLAPNPWSEPVICYFEMMKPNDNPRPPPPPPGPITLKCEPVVPPPQPTR